MSMFLQIEEEVIDVGEAPIPPKDQKSQTKSLDFY